LDHHIDPITNLQISVFEAYNRHDQLNLLKMNTATNSMVRFIVKMQIYHNSQVTETKDKRKRSIGSSIISQEWNNMNKPSIK